MRRALTALALCALCAACALFGGPREPEGVQLVFEGNAGVPRAEVLAAVAPLFEGFAQSPRPLSVVDDAAFEVESLYRARGWAGVRVEYAFDAGARGLPVARFTIAEGPRVRLRELRLVGVAPERAERARSVLLGPEEEQAGRWYSEVQAAAGAGALRLWYRQQGYAQVEVDEPAVLWSDDRAEATVTVQVREGPRFRVAAIDVELEGEAGDVTGAMLREHVRDLIGQPFEERLARAARGRVADALAERGYPEADVHETARELALGEARLRFAARPGPRVRLGEVRFHGQTSTSETFLRRRAGLETGDLYRRSAVRAGVGSLQRSGLFDRVSLALAPATEAAPGAEQVRDVEVELVEARPIEVFLEPGYGSYERLRLGAGFRDRNLFGSGRTLDLSGSVSEKAQRADLSVLDPWLLGPDTLSSATLFWNRRQEPSFLQEEFGLELAATWRLSESLRLRGGWQYRSSLSTDVETDVPDLEEDALVSELTFSPTWDTRDAIDDPRSGHLTRAWADLSPAALGSQIEYARLRLEHTQLVPLGQHTVLALAGQLGWMTPIGGTQEIPLQERFFNGGENSVRSFRESQLGPKDDQGNPIGGEARTVLSAELRQRLAGRLQGALFLDAGNVLLDHQDLLTFADLRYGIGAGLRYVLPIGPVRLDGALNPDPRDDEARGAVHLSVGFAF